MIKSWVMVLGLSASLCSTSVLGNDFWIDVENNRSQAILQYLAQGGDPNLKSAEEQPVIMWAIQNQAWAVYDLLLAHRQFDPNMSNANGETPLMYLAILGENQRAQELIAKGAQVQRLGWTPLHYAASKGQVKTAELLLQKGALVNSPAPDGTTALMMAARSGSRPMIQLLLQRGADPTVLNLNQLSAADWAESNKQTQIAEQLRQLERTYDHRAPSHNGLPNAATTTGSSVKNTTDSFSSTQEKSENTAGTSQYFDLKRFE